MPSAVHTAAAPQFLADSRELASELWSCHPPSLDGFRFNCSSDPSDPLQFGAAFDAGNLFFVSKVSENHFELELRFDDVAAQPCQGPGFCAPANDDDSPGPPPSAGQHSEMDGRPSTSSTASSGAGPVEEVAPRPSAQWFYFAARCPPIAKSQAPSLRKARRTLSDVIDAIESADPDAVPARSRRVRFDIVNVTRPRPRVWQSDVLAPAVWRCAVAASSDQGEPLGSPAGWRRCRERPRWSRTPASRAAIAFMRQGVAVGDDDHSALWTLSFTHSFEPAKTAAESGKFSADRESVGEVAFFSCALPYSVPQLHRMMRWMELASVGQPTLLVERRTLSWRPPHLQTVVYGPADTKNMPVVAEPCELVTCTERVPPADPRLCVGESETRRRRPIFLIFCRERPGEPAASWALQGFMRFLCGGSRKAAAMRNAFEILVAPMLSAGGVSAGQHRSKYEEGVEHEPEWGTAFYLGAKHREAPTPADALRRHLRQMISDGRKVACILEVRGAPASSTGACVCAVGEHPPKQGPASPLLPGDDGTGFAENSEMIRKAIWLRKVVPQRFAEYAADRDGDWGLLARTPRKRTAVPAIFGKELRVGANQEVPMFTFEVPAFGGALTDCLHPPERSGDAGLHERPLCGIRTGALGLALGLALYDCLCGPVAGPGPSPPSSPRPPRTPVAEIQQVSPESTAPLATAHDFNDDRDDEQIVGASEELVPWDEDHPQSCLWVCQPGQRDRGDASARRDTPSTWDVANLGAMEFLEEEEEDEADEGEELETAGESEEDRAPRIRSPSKRPFWETELDLEAVEAKGVQSVNDTGAASCEESSLRSKQQAVRGPSTEQIDDVEELCLGDGNLASSRTTPFQSTGGFAAGSAPGTPAGPTSPLAASRRRLLVGITPAAKGSESSMSSPAHRVSSPPGSSSADWIAASPKNYLVMWRGANSGAHGSEEAQIVSPSRHGRDRAFDSFGTPVAASLPASLLDDLAHCERSTSATASPCGHGIPLDGESPSFRANQRSGRVIQHVPPMWSNHRFVSPVPKLRPPGIRGTAGLPVAGGPSERISALQRTGGWETRSYGSPPSNKVRAPSSPLSPSGGAYFATSPPLGQKRRMVSGGARIVNASSSAPNLRSSAQLGCAGAGRRGGEAEYAPKSPLAARVPVYRPVQQRHQIVVHRSESAIR